MGFVTVPLFAVVDTDSGQKKIEVGHAALDPEKLAGPGKVKEAKTLHLKEVVATHFTFSSKED